MARIGGFEIGIVTTAAALALLSAPPAGAIYLDESREIRLGLRTYVGARIGTQDTTFNAIASVTIDNGNGKARFDLGGDDQAHGLALDRQGRIVLAGLTRVAGVFAANDFALLRSAPPLVFHNDLSATVPRYYWSVDAGYALWLRLYAAAS